MCIVTLIIIVALSVTVTMTTGINFLVALGILLILGTKTGRSGVRAVVSFISGDKKAKSRGKEAQLKQTVVDMTTVGQNIVESTIEAAKKEINDYKEFKAMKRVIKEHSLKDEVFTIEDEPYNKRR